MSRQRRETVRGDAAAAASVPLPEGFRSGLRWREHNHVLTLRCGACGRARAWLLAPKAAVTPEAIAARGYWYPTRSTVRNPCVCSWGAMPDAGRFRGAIVRAVRAGLGLVSEHRALVVVASPPDAERDTPGGAPFAE